METGDELLPHQYRKTIEASDFLLATVQVRVRAAMRNADPGLAAAYANLAVLIQDAVNEARAEGIARIHRDKPEAAAAAGGRR